MFQCTLKIETFLFKPLSSELLIFAHVWSSSIKVAPTEKCWDKAISRSILPTLQLLELQYIAMCEMSVHWKLHIDVILWLMTGIGRLRNMDFYAVEVMSRLTCINGDYFDRWVLIAHTFFEKCSEITRNRSALLPASTAHQSPYSCVGHDCLLFSLVKLDV